MLPPVRLRLLCVLGSEMGDGGGRKTRRAGEWSREKGLVDQLKAKQLGLE